MNGPEPAELVFSHSQPRSPLLSCSSATFWSTTEPTPAARQFSTRVGARLSGIFSSTVMSSVARTIWSTFSGVQPNWLKMKPGVLFSLITRVSENTTSAAVTGLPEWKV